MCEKVSFVLRIVGVDVTISKCMKRKYNEEEKVMRRWNTVVMALILVLNLIVLPREASAAPSAPTVAETIQNGVTLHCWNWSYASIEANMDRIARQGYTAIQVSPIQQAKQNTAGDYMSVWWVYYQPAAFRIDNTGNSALGTKADFVRMCKKAHEYGLYVIVDVVANHMGDNGANQKSPAIIDAIEKDSSCWHDIGKNISNYNSRYDITHYCMDGVPDLNTGSDKIQKYVLNFLKECIDAGADGFRFDAVKHIETPDDASSVASDFWPTVVNGAKDYATASRGIELYCYGELLFHPDESGTLPDSAYTKYFSVTDNSWSNYVRNNVVGAQSAASFSYQYHKDASAKQLVLWAESHDNYAGDGSKNMSVENINKTWALVAARADAMGLYLARPQNFYPQKLGEATLSGWNYSEVEVINRFHHAFVGQGEYVSNEDGIAYVERGTAGAVLVNCGGTSTQVSLTAHTMKDGTYRDQITGNTFRVSGGVISGSMGSTGIAVVYNAESCDHPSHNAYGACTNCHAKVGHNYGEDGLCSCGASKPQGRMIYFANTDHWSKVNIYSWTSGGTEITESWPGDAMTKITDDLYSYLLPPEAENVIFSNGSIQTSDLVLPNLSDGLDLYDYATDTWRSYRQEDSSDEGTYYLFGYINGEDHGCESDASSMGDYPFVNGTLTATFECASYVAVKKADNVGWYMTNGWLGTDVKEAVLYDTAITGENSNKLYVPGGVELTFTLDVNADGSLTLQYRFQGDANDDGKINMGDVAAIYAHVQGKIVISDAYRLRCADVTGDGKVNIGDTARLYATIRAHQ